MSNIFSIKLEILVHGLIFMSLKHQHLQEDLAHMCLGKIIAFNRVLSLYKLFVVMA